MHNGAYVIGFTGTREGMTAMQKLAVMRILDISHAEAPAMPCAMHGDCIGADAEYDAICKMRGLPVKIRPANIESMRARCDSEVIASPRPPLTRNRDIVADSDVMIACPGAPVEVLRSGTWSTVRAARSAKKKLFIVRPDGSITTENMTAVA